MNTDALRELWKEAFADPDSFIDAFFATGFSPARYETIHADGQLAAALYWFDCQYRGKRLAYIYAVATAKAHRGKGLCRKLMENTHARLKVLGYSGSILVPAEEGLFTLYSKLGYGVCAHVETFSRKPGTPVALTPLTARQYAQKRGAYLPAGGVTQDTQTLDFLATWCEFYQGTDCLLCAAREDGKLYVQELLGNRDAAPGIVATLGTREGVFRTPGESTPFAMYYPLDDSPAPSYLGLALD